MSAGPDWGDRETALALLLGAARAPSVRARLLANLAEYSSGAVREARRVGSIVPSAADCERALEWLLRPVFICGHHRSGTTLLQNLLDGHPELLSLPSEGTYFSSFAYVARRGPANSDLDRFTGEWISRFVDPNFEPHFKLGRSDGTRAPAVEFARFLFGWHEALRRRVPEPFAPLLALAAAYHAVVATPSVPQAWVEKTPLNERYAGRLAFVGAARFIQVVRDPRAVLASLGEIYRTAASDRFDAASSARSIGRSLRLAKENRRRLGGRYLVVRYEDLVGEPAKQIECVRRFLGIAPHGTLTVPTSGGRAVAANSAFAGYAASIEPARPPPVMPAEHLALLGVYAGTVARELGYEILVPSPWTRCAQYLRYWPRQILRAAGALHSVRRNEVGS